MPESSGDAELDRALVELRPQLHRYCARMTGSVVDGEDVLQDAIVKAIRARPDTSSIAQLEAWLFRVAHNTAIDFLRKRARQNDLFTDKDTDMIGNHARDADDRATAATSLLTLMELPVLQRSSVILKDVLGYSVQEIGTITDTTIPSVKAALNRGRTRLRELALSSKRRSSTDVRASRSGIRTTKTAGRAISSFSIGTANAWQTSATSILRVM
jgi:RNA polymerase sigma-70 factor (ECF subfamily)